MDFADIAFLTYGSRGDLQPFLALAVGLQKAGHRVRLAAPHRFSAFVAQYGVPFVPLPGEPEVISQRLNDAGANPFGMACSIGDYVSRIALSVARAAFVACHGTTLLVHSFLFTVGGHSWAYEHGIADVSVQTFPMFAPTRAFPHPAVPQLPPGRLSYLSHWLAERAFWLSGNLGYRVVRRAAADLSLPRRLYWPFVDSAHHPRTPLLFAYSPSVLPRPSDWGEGVHVNGYLFLDMPAAYRPPSALVEFLAEEPPICVTFGSMVRRDATHIYRIVLEALEQTRQRAVILSGWNDWQNLSVPPNVLVMEAVPHDWLLPRCKAVIHYGGAGTTAAGLRAGIPNIVIPFAADQPFWGARVHAIGAGPLPIPIRALTTRRLGAALAEAEGEACRNGAQEAGRKIRAEDGLGRAIHLIESAAKLRP